MITPSVLAYLTSLIFGFIEFILGIRIFLKALGANLATPFARWINETTQPLLFPFQGIFPNSFLGDGSVVEISTLFALLVYAIIGYSVIQLIEMVTFRVEEYRQTHGHVHDV